MRMSEFRRACAAELSAHYSGVVIRDHWITSLGGTALDALDRGVPARDIWQALCVDLGVPVERRHGRGLLDPRSD